MKTSFPITRGFLRRMVKTEDEDGIIRNKQSRKIVRAMKKFEEIKRKMGIGKSGQKCCKDAGYVCSICKRKKYKYKRNRLRHEKYECMGGPQFSCETCGKRYSQKKTLIAHIALKHLPPVKKEEPTQD